MEFLYYNFYEQFSVIYIHYDCNEKTYKMKDRIFFFHSYICNDILCYASVSVRNTFLLKDFLKR